MVTAAEKISPGTLLDKRYRIERVLGRGGFGRTYLAADHRRFGELCVIKEFIANGGNDDVMVQKLRELFQREATILHKLDHPQIPKFLAWFEKNGRLFIVQEYVDGKTYWQMLQERQWQGKTFTAAEIVRWLWYLLCVLGYVHGQNIVHRDISPDNIMLPNGKSLPVLIDFGVVKQTTQTQGDSNEISDGVIQASVAVGKFGYSPYEQIRMGQCSPGSDLYALGVTAVVLLTGKRPHKLINPRSLEWQWHSLVNIDERLVAILDKMMAEKPQDRYSSAQAVLNDLRHLSKTAEQGAKLFSDQIGNQTSWVNSSDLTFHLTEPPPKTSNFQPESDLEPTDLSLRRLQSGASPVPSGAQSRVRSSIHAETLIEQSSVRPTLIGRPLNRSPLKIAAIAFLMVLPLGGTFVGVRSPYIASLCQTLSNCAKDQVFAERYRQAMEAGSAAEAQAANPQELAELHSARDRLKETVEILNTIPKGVAVHPQAQQALLDYQNSLAEVENRLEQEIKAADSLDRAEVIAQAASELMSSAVTALDFAAVRDRWQTALDLLQAIPADTLAADPVRAKIEEYIAKIQSTNSIIATAEKHQQQTATPQPIVATASPTRSNSVSQQRSANPHAVGQRSATQRPASSGSPARLSTPSRTSTSRSSATPVRQPVRQLRTSPQLASVRSSSVSNQSLNGSYVGNVALAVAQTLNQVEVRLDGAEVSPGGNLVANLIVENRSDRAFGFVPLFVRVQDRNGREIRSRVLVSNSRDGVAPPGGTLQGQVYVLGGRWNRSGSQNLTLVIQEGTSGGRLFRMPF